MKQTILNSWQESGTLSMIIQIFVLKTNPWTDKIKDLDRKNNRKFLLKRIIVEYVTNELLS